MYDLIPCAGNHWLSEENCWYICDGAGYSEHSLCNIPTGLGEKWFCMYPKAQGLHWLKLGTNSHWLTPVCCVSCHSLCEWDSPSSRNRWACPGNFSYSVPYRVYCCHYSWGRDDVLCVWLVVAVVRSCFNDDHNASDVGPHLQVPKGETLISL